MGSFRAKEFLDIYATRTTVHVHAKKNKPPLDAIVSHMNAFHSFAS